MSAQQRAEFEQGTEDLVDDVFAAAFDEALSASSTQAESEPEPEVAATADPEPESATTATTAQTPETPAAAPVAPEAKAEPAAALTADDVTKAVAEALAKTAPAAKEPPVAPTAEELAAQEAEDAAIADLTENWKTHEVAINAIVKRTIAATEKRLEEKYQKMLEPLQAQIAPVVANAEFSAAEKHKADILAGHADAFELVPEVEKWIADQPKYLQPAYSKVLDEGTAAEIVDLFSQFKTATNRVSTDNKAAEAAAAAAKAKADKLRKMEVVPESRTSSSAEPDPDNFDDAFDAEAKKYTKAA